MRPVHGARLRIQAAAAGILPVVVLVPLLVWYTWPPSGGMPPKTPEPSPPTEPAGGANSAGNAEGSPATSAVPEVRGLVLLVNHSGAIHTLRVPAGCPVAAVKEMIPGIDPSRQRLLLLLAGEELGDDRTLADRNVQNGTTLQLVPVPATQPSAATPELDEGPRGGKEPSRDGDGGTPADVVPSSSSASARVSKAVAPPEPMSEAQPPRHDDAPPPPPKQHGSSWRAPAAGGLFGRSFWPRSRR